MAQAVTNPPANAGDTGSIPGSGRSPGERDGNPLKYSCLGNPMDREAWQAIAHGVAKSQTRLSTHAHRDVTLGQCSCLFPALCPRIAGAVLETCPRTRLCSRVHTRVCR